MTAARGKTKGASLSVILVTAFVLFGTWYAFARPVPETVNAITADGQVVLQGRGPSNAQAFVREHPEKGRPYAALRSGVYELALPVSGSFTAVFHFTPLDGEAPGQYTLFTSPNGQDGWVSTSAVLDPLALTLTRSVTFRDTGYWAVGVRVAGE